MREVCRLKCFRLYGKG